MNLDLWTSRWQQDTVKQIEDGVCVKPSVPSSVLPGRICGASLQYGNNIIMMIFSEADK